LFVALDHGVDSDDELRARIVGAIRTGASPRHVPDDVVAVPGIPRTMTGKRLEIPIKRILLGARPSDVLTPSAVDPPGRFGPARAVSGATQPQPAPPTEHLRNPARCARRGGRECGTLPHRVEYRHVE
jgi:hypothetical protein